MKRNESFLVYGVTGLLVIILLVAVVFGDEGLPTPASPDGAGQGEGGGDLVANANEPATDSLADLLNLDPVERAMDGATPEEAVGGPAPAVPAGSVGDGAAPQAELGSTAAPLGGLDDDPVDAALRAAVTPSAAPVEPAVGSSAPVAAATTAPRDPSSTRIGNYRRVPVRAGDTFSTLVQRWCGSLDFLPVAEALNEDLDRDRLPVGRQILLPWVDDAIVERASKERMVSSAKLDAATGQSYELKRGDSLWEIAVDKTGSRSEAPAYIERILRLNPGIVPERLLAGQQIVLPPH